MNKNKKPLLLLVLPQVQEGLFCCIHLEATPLSSYMFFKSFMAMCSESLIQVS